MSAGLVFAIVASGFFTGALARLAVPGPDPMPLWLTTAIGLAGSIVGALVARGLGGGGYAVSFTSLFLAIGLVMAYRRFVQHRPLAGPDALRFPKSGLGVDQARERLKKAGIDPDAASPLAALQAQAQAHAQPHGAAAPRLEAMLDELHRAGILDDAELDEKRRVVQQRGA
jgi:uncharacterized membrane protein YeaQ/YmgE (transglycosylase-associated protein family)